MGGLKRYRYPLASSLFPFIDDNAKSGIFPPRQLHPVIITGITIPDTTDTQDLCHH